MLSLTAMLGILLMLLKRINGMAITERGGCPMEHLCIGSYVRILTSCAIQARKKFDSFCEMVMLSLCEDGATSFSYTANDGSVVTYDYTNFGKIHTSSQNLPSEITNMALQKNPYDIEKYFLKVVVPAIDEGNKKNAVLALKNVILKDGDIVETSQIGNLTKADLRAKNEFVLSEFLTDVFIYSITKTDNTKEQAFTKSISKTFCSAYNMMRDEVTLYEVRRPNPVAAIPSTSKGKFDKVFSAVSSEQLHISSNHDLQIYSLKFDDYDFDYRALWRHLGNNLGLYLYSRVQTQRYIDDEEINLLVMDAINYIKQEIADGRVNTDDELGEMLLYIFLEQVLKAPKLMSKMEIGNIAGSITSKSSGIHLLTFDAAVPYSEIILGTSMIKDDLKDAIDAAFLEANNLKNRKKDERRFVESNIFAASFSNKMYDQLEAIILPSGPGSKKPTTAFGIFLGYSLSQLPQSRISVEDYQNDVTSLIKMDLQNHVPYIESKIAEYGFDGYSLYVYLLPFKDANEDKKDFIGKIACPEGVM